MSTANLNLDDMTVAQSGKYLTYNEAIKMLDALLGGVIDRDTAAEPGSPSDGDMYILPASPTGTNWASYSENDLVVYRGTEWVAVAPFEGFGPFWVNDEDILVVWDGTGWVDANSTLSNGADELAGGEVDQLKNIDSNTISNAQWGHLGALDQGLATTDTPTFDGVNLGSVSTWDPEVWDGSLTDELSGGDYDIQVGHTFKVGKIRFISGRIKVNSLGSLTTTHQMRIGGLPEAAHNQANGHQGVIFSIQQSLSLGGNYRVHGFISPNTSYIALKMTDSTAGGTNLLLSEFGASGDLAFSAFYMVD